MGVARPPATGRAWESAAAVDDVSLRGYTATVTLRTVQPAHAITAASDFAILSHMSPQEVSSEITWTVVSVWNHG